MTAAWVGLVCLLLACGGGARQRPRVAPAAVASGPEQSPPPRDPSSIIADRAALEWARYTASPVLDMAPALRLRECVAYERPLVQVALAVARAVARGIGATELTDVAALSRALGTPHVWPRVWVFEARSPGDEALFAEWSRWVSREPSAGERRCGTARLQAEDGRHVAVAVVVDALADLEPIPLRARLGQWLRLEARLLVPARGGGLVLLAPDGSLRNAPGSLAAGVFHSAFSLDQPGLWRLQVSFDTGAGPRPALEAWAFVDHDPDLGEALAPAPGEGPALPPDAPRDVERAALARMIAGARSAYGLSAPRRDPKLDDLAQAHAEAMLRAGRTAHDVGDGLPPERVAKLGVLAHRVGENVARATSLERAHRALWDSPSHRRNLLDAGFDALGVGVARADARDVWVCEIFADYGREPARRPTR